MEKRLRISGALILTGLLAELASLFWSHPTAFLAFLVGGGSFLLGGMLFFLYSLVGGDDSQAGSERATQTNKPR